MHENTSTPRAASADETPAAVYAHRLAGLNATQAAEQRRERLLGYAKLAVAAFTLLYAFFSLHYTYILEFITVPIGVFLVLGVLQERHIRRLRFRARAIDFFARGIARIEDRWKGTGESGERFLDPAHPYARDLDLFGPGSLFELLCTARTRAGEQTLAAWLLAPAPVHEVLARQHAVRELEARVGFRAKLFSLGESVRLGVHPEMLAAWGERKPLFTSLATRIITRTLSLLWVMGLVAWAYWGLLDVAAAVTILNLAWAHQLYRRLDAAADALEKATDGLEVLAGVLALLEQEDFHALKLKSLQAAIKRDGIPPSVAIRKLARIVDYENSRHNPGFRLIDVVLFLSAQLVFTAERWQAEFGPAIRGWLTAVGELEALTALAGYAFEHPADVLPEFVAPGPDSGPNSDPDSGPAATPLFDAQAMAHPLLPDSKAIRNDLKLGDGLQLLILSGPNMAGKSTFIRSVGVNAILAQAGAPVRAARLRLSPLTVAASICILDSLSGGISRFYAEIHRVKLIYDLAGGGLPARNLPAGDLAAGDLAEGDLADSPTPVLFLLDELLSGTNSHDRLAGSEFIVRSLMDRNAIGMVSTHDLALTHMAETLPGRAINLHFADQYADGALTFDYTLKPGVVQTSNALELMRSIGLKVGEQPDPK